MYKMCHEPINVSREESETMVPELDHLPLTTRRSLLQSNSVSVPALNVDSIVKREEDCVNELGVVSVNTLIPEPTSIGCSQGLLDSGNLRPHNNILVCCSNAEESFERVEHIEETVGSDDALEHLTLKERRKILLERMVLRLPEPNLEDDAKDCNETDLYTIKAENSCKNGIASSSGVRFSGFLEKIDSFLYKKSSIGSVSGTQLRKLRRVQENELSPEASLHELFSRDNEHAPLSTNCYAARAEQQRVVSVKRVKRNPSPLNVTEVQLSQEKCESLDDCAMENNDERNHVSSEQVQVKREVETYDEDELDCVKLSSRLNRCTSAPGPASFVKNEAETTSESDEDEIDHMKLIDRLKLRSSHGSGHEKDPSSPSSGFSFCTSDEYVKPLRKLRPWKRKKTATNSIETALEEDAPGLLQVLIQQGVSVDELRLYGEEDAHDDDSLLKESFSELEDVISQLCFKRATGPKLLNLSFTKASRTSYCLTCLFSLIEQARYLRFRKWPVEWGWCRDIQSFIFVFERHNRIVMERPEYGYATYFFELSSTASIKWQIKRLVLAMKLGSCSRYQLLENKPLLAGEDMTEGEAEVLMKYGWVANTGLGTMLNYRDRVYHDRKSHKETSEWKSKISKLLVDGYNSGTIVSTFITHRDDVEDDGSGLEVGDVKLETY